MQTPFGITNQQDLFDRGLQADPFFALKEHAQILTAANRQRMILRANEDAMINDLQDAR